ncbi:MAG UNVERIFIED_CONTAM: hypothetical protein LVR18_49670 [Planctomycetaceae bacterium]
MSCIRYWQVVLRIWLRVRGRWKKYVHGGIALLLLSGGFNYWRAIAAGRVDGIYHAMVDTKILLAMGSFFLSSAPVGRSAGTQRSFAMLHQSGPGWCCCSAR